MKSLIPVVLSSVFATGCAHSLQKNQLPPENTLPPMPTPSAQSATPEGYEANDSIPAMKLSPPFLHLASAIRVRPFGTPTGQEQIITIEAVIGNGSDGKTWGCRQILQGNKALTPSDYESLETKGGSFQDPNAPLTGLDCAPVEVDLSPLEEEKIPPKNELRPNATLPAQPNHEEVQQGLANSKPLLSL